MLRRSLQTVSHLIGKFTRKYYFEDYIRVYPNGVAFNRFGLARKPDKNDLNNFMNHMKFYEFVAQFVKGRDVIDVGCGSGYGCNLLKEKGARAVAGVDISKNAIKFAKKAFGQAVGFEMASALDLKSYTDKQFDLSISSEVLEHLKEYGKESEAISELKRVTKTGGLVVIGTPNSEMLGDHGFCFEEIQALLAKHFEHYLVIENALLPFADEAKKDWLARKELGNTALCVKEVINLEETVLPINAIPEIKDGMPPLHDFCFHDLRVDLGLLHNTHSWIVLATND